MEGSDPHILKSLGFEGPQTRSYRPEVSKYKYLFFGGRVPFSKVLSRVRVYTGKYDINTYIYIIQYI